MTHAPGWAPRTWDVLLIGGGSGVGKSTLSQRLAGHFGVGLLEFDDVVEAVKALTTPEQQPVLHHWDTHPNASRMPVTDIVALTVEVARVLQPAIEAVVANHLEASVPVVIEGDYLLPGLASQGSVRGIPTAGRVRVLLLHEPDEARIRANFERREPQHGDQSLRASVTWHYGRWLATAAHEAGVPVLSAWPWDTLEARALAALV